jgi:hypothetical protein
MNDDKEVRLEELEASALPLSEREENPPLIVDLPDGQKLLVGDIKAGTVIEVATWRGTGRPDSRTQRFMLGISHDEPDVSQSVSTPQVQNLVVTTPVPPVAFEQLPLPPEVSENLNINRQALEVVSENRSDIVEIAPEPIIIEEIDQPKVGIADEVAKTESFIQTESLTSRIDLLFGTTSRSLENYSPQTPTSYQNKQLVAPISKSKVKRKIRFEASTAYSLLGVLAVVAMFWFSNIAIVHPKSGLPTALGDAQSTVMFVKSKASYSVGESIVGKSSARDGNPVFGMVDAVGDNVYMLKAPSGFVPVAQKDVRGKVIAIAPWWGKLVSLFDQ